jgi:acetyl esterase/lipase
MAHLRARTESWVFRLLLGLPPWLVRRLAGRPVVVDGQALDAETQWLLRLERLLREPPVASLPIPDGWRALLRQARLTGGQQPIGETRDLDVPTPAGPMRARLYVPRSEVSTGRFLSLSKGSTDRGETARIPLLVFLHGGGMIYGDLDSHDAVCRLLAERAAVRVLALDYRLAPEHRYPAAVEDCWAGFEWAVEHAAELGADAERVAVGGDSAGGMLSAIVAVKAAQAGVPCAFQLLVYPATNFHEKSASRARFGQGFYLTDEFMDLAEASYLDPTDDRRDPLISVLFTEKVPEGLAPALVVTAGFDPLRDEGEDYARMLADAGAQVELRRYGGFIHGFLNMVGVGRSNRAAVAEIAADLEAALRR